VDNPLLGLGDTFLLAKSDRASSLEHLWIVLTEPSLADGNAVCVSVSTQRSGSEATVVLRPGEHPFLKHDSVIFYKDARVIDLVLVQQALESRLGYRHAKCSENLLRRVQDGLLASKQPSNDIKEFCRTLWAKAKGQGN
jgi:hypothetical protein